MSKALFKPFQKVADTTATVVKKTGKTVTKGVTKTVDTIKHPFSGTEKVSNVASSPSSEPQDTVQDPVLPRMTVILKGTLQCTTQQFFDDFWKDPTFYREFLEEGSESVNLPDTWETGSFQGSWDQQSYSLLKKTQMEIAQTSPLFSGTVHVTQTMYASQNKDSSTVVLAMQNEAAGVPFADTFQVQIRWVVSKLDQTSVQVQVGLFVCFVKSCIVSSQIQRVATAETKLAHQTLLQRIQEKLGQTVTMEVPEPMKPAENPFEAFFRQIADFFHLKPQEDDIQKSLKNVQAKLQKVRHLKHIRDTAYVESELTVVREYLNEIILRHMNLNDELQKSLSNIKDDEPQEMQKSFLPTLLKPGRTFMTDLSKSVDKLKPLGSMMKKAALMSMRDLNEPDHILQGMNVILSQKISGTSIEVIRHTFVVEEKKRMQYMEEHGCTNIKFGRWEKAPNGKPFIEKWSEDPFDYKRTTSYQYANPYIAYTNSLKGNMVTQTNEELYYVVEGQKLVVAHTTKLSGISLADCYEIHSRSVFTKDPDGSLEVKVGIHILFTAFTVMESQIRATFTRDYRKKTRSFFRSLQGTVSAFRELDKIVDEKLMEEYTEEKDPGFAACLAPFQNIGSVFDGSEKFPPTLSEAFDKVEKRLRVVEQVIRESNGENLEDLNFYDSQLEIVEMTLDSILKWHDQAP